MERRKAPHITLAKFIAIGVKQYRQRNGMKQADLEDNQISKSTIGNIECAKHVGWRKINYLARKTDLDLSAFLEPARNEYTHQFDRMRLYYQIIETAINFGVDDDIMNQVLANVPVSVDDHFMWGKHYFRKGEFIKAASEFSQSIALNKLQDRNSNIVPASYLELSYYFSSQKDPLGALRCVEHGFEAFVSNRTTQQHKHMLLLYKAIYLRRLSRNEESLECVSMLWSHLHEIRNMHLLLAAYSLRVNILMYMRRYNEAMKFCLEGLDLARQNKHRHAVSQFLNDMGDIKRELLQLDDATSYYLLATSGLTKINENKTFTELLQQAGAGKSEQTSQSEQVQASKSKRTTQSRQVEASKSKQTSQSEQVEASKSKRTSQSRQVEANKSKQTSQNRQVEAGKSKRASRSGQVGVGKSEQASQSEKVEVGKLKRASQSG